MKGKIASVYDNISIRKIINFLPCCAFDINFLLLDKHRQFMKINKVARFATSVCYVLDIHKKALLLSLRSAL